MEIYLPTIQDDENMPKDLPSMIDDSKETKEGKQGLTAEAYLRIRRMFFYKEIVPGQKILYRDLVDRLKMSPTPVLQALKWLEFQGLIEHIPYRGYFTTPFSLQEIRENFEVRALIEISLLPNTIKLLDKEGIRKLEASLEAHKKADGGNFINERLIKDRDFHLTLASLSKAKVQVEILTRLFDSLFLKYRGGYFSGVERTRTIEEHQKILNFVVAHDLKNARKAMSNHLSNAKRQVIRTLKELMESKKINGI